MRRFVRSAAEVSALVLAFLCIIVAFTAVFGLLLSPGVVLLALLLLAAGVSTQHAALVCLGMLGIVAVIAVLTAE